MESAYADAVGVVQQPRGTINVPEPSLLLGIIIRNMIIMVAIFAIIGVTWWGILFVTTVGNDEKMKKARNTLIYSLVGVLIAGLAYGFVTILSGIRI